MQDLYIAAERLKKELSSIMTRRYFLRYRGAVTQVELTRDTAGEAHRPPARPDHLGH